MAALRRMVNKGLPHMVNQRLTLRWCRTPYLASLSSGDQAGSEAKDGVGTGNSTLPVMSTI
jgi:hypothetical protein